MDDDESPAELELIPCDVCSRKFNPEVLSRHKPICEKNAAKKRKVFDSSKQRSDVLGPSAPPARKPEKEKPTPKKTNWRQKHESFLQSLKAARDVSAALSRGEKVPPPPPPVIDPDYVQCEFCQRRFNVHAAERHIPFCKEQSIRQKIKSADDKKAALNTRTKYQPPKLGSKKRVTSNSRIPSGPRTENNNPSNMKRTTVLGNSPTVNRYANGQTYDEDLYSDNRPTSGDSRSSSGRPLRTGRNPETYSNGIAISRQQKNVGYSKPTSRGRGLASPSGRSRPPVGSGSQHQSSSAGPPAKFCHDCGTKYATTTAKFCVECGIRRVSIPT
ncbi:DgyrCDS8841 [Dimorphilus gyrociliatus]|uniref:DgyrCDS8841 n=1 Tax=Dimorphilus gyrociliatus TaxID=2664684 RepID=A0A7I8VVL0_9ANNE|nr:DgyrCDS8841 [Dimorphilus gyrociliatus]